MEPQRNNLIKINLYKLAIAVLLITAIVVCTMRACNRLQPTTQPAASGTVITPQIPRTYKTVGGTVHTEVKVVEAASDVWLKDYYESLLISVRDSLQLKDSEIDRLTALSLHRNNHLVMPVDSVYYTNKNNTPCPEPIRTFRYADTNIKVAGMSTADSTYLSYYYTDSLHLVSYWKRSKFLGKKELYLNAFSTSPNATIKGLQGLKLSIATPKKWAIGLQGGYYLTGNGFQPAFGIGITRTIIRF